MNLQTVVEVKKAYFSYDGKRVHRKFILKARKKKRTPAELGSAGVLMHYYGKVMVSASGLDFPSSTVKE